MLKVFFILFFLSFSLFAKTQVNINVSQIRVSEFIKLVSYNTKVTIINPYELDYFFDISSNSVIFDDELIGILDSVLRSNGYSLIRKNSTYEIIKNDDFEIYKSDFKTSVIDLKYIDSLQALESIKHLLSKNSIISQISSSKILLSDFSKNIDMVKKIIKSVDVFPDQTLKIYQLKNAKVQDVFNSLQLIINNQKYIIDIKKPTISYSEDTNSLFIVGDFSIIEKYDSLINFLDREKYQVYIQAQIVEINNQEAINAGIKYGFDGAKLFNDNGLLSFSSNFGGSALQGSLVSLYSENIRNFSLGAALDFLETNGVSKSISNPSLLCIDNKECSIYVGKTISITTGQFKDSNSAVSNTFDRSDVGLKLKILPRVSDLNKINLDISVILENIIDDNLQQPITTKQDINTNVILRDGESILIGGLSRSYEYKSISKIPFLGDIPLLGDFLFSSSTDQIKKDNLVLILTPHILENSSKISDLQNELAILQKLQNDYTNEVLKHISFGGEK